MLVKYGLNRQIMALVGFVELFGATTIWFQGSWIGAIGALAILGTSVGAIGCHLIWDTWRDAIPAMVTAFLSSFVVWSGKAVLFGFLGQPDGMKGWTLRKVLLIDRIENSEASISHSSVCGTADISELSTQAIYTFNIQKGRLRSAQHQENWAQNCRSRQVAPKFAKGRKQTLRLRSRFVGLPRQTDSHPSHTLDLAPFPRREALD